MVFCALISAIAVTCLWATAALAQAGAQTIHHNSIALIIGNQKYRHTTPVTYAHNDARAIEKYLIERLGFRRGNILVRLDVGREQMETLFGEPDRADGELMDRLLDRRQENRGDVFVFYSGHGVPDPDAVTDDGRRAFLLPTDVRQDRITTAAFPIDRLHKKLELVRGQLPAERRVVLMMDACFSGRTPIARGTQGGDGPDASLFKFSRGSFTVRADEPTAGVVRLVAATGDQVAYWDEQRKLGLFTSLFLRGVSGEADGTDFGNGDRIVAGDELVRFLEERVPAEARLRHQRTQRPTLEGLDRFAWTLPRP
ncbi:MAG: caspase family protein [Beijerinckiaceae bacterium]